MRQLYDAAGNVTYRQINSVVERFRYDALHRLSQITRVVGGRGQSTYMTYDALGNITSKTGVGTYEYGGAQPHAVTATNLDGTRSEYAYDLRGNQVARPGFTMTHNAHNKVATLTNTRTNALAARYVYDADGTRVWQEDGEGVRTMVGGLYERHARTDGSVDHTWTIQAPEAVAIKVRKSVRNANVLTKTLYPILDRLGSPIVTVDEAGAVVQSQLFDAWGKLEGVEGGEASRPKVNLGYTGHTAEDVYGIIDMGGRQYDPVGRFLQPDIVIQAPENMQSFNRYTYVFNNPFRYRSEW